MSATLTPPEAVAPAPLVAPRERSDRRTVVGDRGVVALLLLAFGVVVALSWRKWGMPEGDAGAELTTADLIKHGALIYRDVRYFYGPLGVYSLALAFKLFGTSLTVVYAFGLVQAAAILAVFYLLARQWLAPVTAGLTTAVLMAIGFSGTSVNFVVPHTNSATFGLLTLLLMLLALRRERLIAAGVAAGLVGLTRPEFLAVAAGAALAYVVAIWRTDGRRPALAALWRLALPGALIPGLILGWFAARAGLSNLLWQNLWPTKFLKAGVETEANWMPLSLAGAFGLIARATVYLSLLGGLLLSAERLSQRRGWSRLAAIVPLVLACVALAAADGVLRVSGVFAGERSAIQTEVYHLIVGMSWLPALALGTFLWAALKLWRRDEAPLGGSWAADFALIVAAVGLGLRAYNAFTAEASYAPYYAAPAVLLLGIFHARLAERRPQARAAALGALGVVALGLAAFALFGLYRHIDTPVHTARGTFLTTAAAGPALGEVIREVDADTRPGDRILAGPVDGGLYFFTDRRPALHELTILPGLIATTADQEAAVSQLRREHVAMAVFSARANGAWGNLDFGVGYDRLVGDYVRGHAQSRWVVGSLADPIGGTYPSRGYTIYRLER